LGNGISRVAGYYRSLFTLSTTLNHLVAYYVLSLLFYLRFQALFGDGHPLLALLFATAPLLDYLLLGLIFPDNGFFTLRRVLALNASSTLLLLIPPLLLSFTPYHPGLFPQI
jgi:hypothetical protein